MSQASEQLEQSHTSIFYSFISLGATILNILLAIVPASDVYNIFLTKDTEKYPYAFFLMQSLGNFFWTFYGLKINSFVVIITSLVAMILNMIYMLIFIYCKQIKTNIKIDYMIGYILIFFSLFFIEFETNIKASVFGTIGTMFSILSALTTMQKLKEILEFHDSHYIPIRLNVVYFTNSLFWVIYAILNNYNIYILIPNSLSICLNGFEIFLYVKYTHESINNDENSDNTLKENIKEKDNQKVI